KEHIDARVSLEAAAIASEAMNQARVANERRTGLETQLRWCIKQLAARIDRGAKVEVSVLLKQQPATVEASEQETLRQEIVSRGALMSETPQLEQPVLALTLESESPAPRPRSPSPTN